MVQKHFPCLSLIWVILERDVYHNRRKSDFVNQKDWAKCFSKNVRTMYTNVGEWHAICYSKKCHHTWKLGTINGIAVKIYGCCSDRGTSSWNINSVSLHKFYILWRQGWGKVGVEGRWEEVVTSIKMSLSLSSVTWKHETISSALTSRKTNYKKYIVVINLLFILYF